MYLSNTMETGEEDEDFQMPVTMEEEVELAL